MPARETLGRTVALVGLAVRRVLGRARGPGWRRQLLTVSGVVVAVALIVTVTSVSLGLAAGSAIQADGVDYWLVPEGGAVDTVAVESGGPALGDVHPVAERIARDDRVRYATPVLVRITPLVNTATGTREYVVLLGVVRPPADAPAVAGIPTRPLSPSDPHYANGTYEGPWTGELVANDAAATVLDASPGTDLAAAGTDRTFTVTDVAGDEAATGAGAAPVALVQLGELQSATGAASDDRADQVVVSTNAPGVRDRLAELYPRTRVVTRTGFLARGTSTDSLPLAMGLAALVVAVVVGTLFVATTMGLAVSADRRYLAALAALGFSGRSLAVLVVAETLTLAVLGGGVGVVLGAAGTVAVNLLADQFFGVGTIAVFRPVLAVYGVGVGAVIGLLSAPYPVVLARRGELLEVLDE